MDKNLQIENLIIANKELLFQKAEYEKKVAELIIANKELALQNKEKEKNAQELLSANQQLFLQNEEKEKRAAELIVAYGELAMQDEEKEKRTAELLAATLQLKQAELFQKEYIEGLKEMMFMVSHKLRRQIAIIQGILNHLETTDAVPGEQKEMEGFLRSSTQTLDTITWELTNYIYQQEQKLKH